MKERLDKYLVNKKIVSTRSKAKELIENNCIEVNNKIINKCSFLINDDDSVIVKDNDYLKYVSRGGLKLEGAIKSFDIDFNNKVVMDIGSSTGGFTDCALQHGAKRVIAIDVGTDLMVDNLRNDNRVELYEQLNIKNAPSVLFNDIDIIVSDVSFISLKHVIDRIAKENNSYDLVFLIKPQFECGKDIATRYKGIIRNQEVHINIIEDLVNYFEDKGYYLNGLDVSPIHGGDGNIEYVSYFKKCKNNKIDIKSIVIKGFM